MELKDLRDIMRGRLTRATLKIDNQVVVGDYMDYLDYTIYDIELGTYIDHLDMGGLVVKPVLIIHLLKK